MSNPDEPYYCSQQINIPPELPDILKQFTKAAIRTQPKDVLAWSAAYFRAMANGEMPPVKDRLEMPTATQKTDTGLTPGLLRILHKQVVQKSNVLTVLTMKTLVGGYTWITPMAEGKQNLPVMPDNIRSEVKKNYI